MSLHHTIVVGGTRGLGRATADAFAAKGHNVSIIGLRPPTESDKAISGLSFFKADLTDEKEICQTLDTIHDQKGLINNLIFTHRYKGTPDWNRSMAVNVGATRTIIEKSAGRFAPEGSKSIVVVSSLSADYVTSDQGPDYHVGKAAVDQLARYYAVTLGSTGIRVNIVSPVSFIKSESREHFEKNRAVPEMFQAICPLGRMCTSQDIVGVIDFLCGPNAVFVTGQRIVVDGGMSLLLQESLARRFIK